jgi:hypothetical protein
MNRPDIAKVRGNAGLVKDLKTGAVLNKNGEQFAAFDTQRKKKKEIEALKSQINTLEETQTKILDILGTILEKVDGRNTKHD